MQARLKAFVRTGFFLLTHYVPVNIFTVSHVETGLPGLNQYHVLLKDTTQCPALGVHKRCLFDLYVLVNKFSAMSGRFPRCNR